MRFNLNDLKVFGTKITFRESEKGIFSTQNNLERPTILG